MFEPATPQRFFTGFPQFLRNFAYGLLALAFVVGSMMFVPQAAHADPGDDPSLPNLTQSFGPASVAPNVVSTLTYTVTNNDTSAKPGLSFTNTLPAGLLIGSTPAPSTTCTASTLTAAAASNTVTWSGELAASAASCTVTVSVVASAEGTYANSAFAVSGLNSPLSATLTVQDVPIGWGVCPTEGYLFQNTWGNRQSDTEVFAVNLVTGEKTTRGTVDANINAAGFNQVDNNIWGWNRTTRKLTRINADLTHTDFNVTGINNRPKLGYAIGDVSADGVITLTGLHNDTGTGPKTWVSIDLTTSPPQVVAQGTRTPRPTAMFDWASVSSGGLLYGVGGGQGNRRLFSLNPVTGNVVNVAGLPAMNGIAGSGPFGATYAAGGYLYVSDNAKGTIWRIDAESPGHAVQKFAPGPISTGNDGARCAAALLDLDFGDAPDSYSTLLDSDGPRTEISSDLFLGNVNSAENDGLPGVDADGDGGDDGVDGGNGYGVNLAVAPGAAPSVSVMTTNLTGDAATLTGWVDLDQSGTFDSGEGVSVTVPSGTDHDVQTLTFPTISTGFTGTTYARFRLVGETGLVGPAGPFAIGEVEDYRIDADSETEITLLKNVVSRDNASDQFTLAISGPSGELGTATTAGTATGVQAEQVGPITVTADGATQFTLTESAAGGTDLANYSTTWTCVDSANGNALLSSGSGLSISLTPTTLQAPVCTFTNTVIPPGPAIIVKKNIVDRVGAGDQFLIGATGTGLSGAIATTTGTTAGVQDAVVNAEGVVVGADYVIYESAAGTTTASSYESSYVCIDIANGDLLIAEGDGVGRTFTFPANNPLPAIVECTFTNRPVAPTLTLRKNIVERAATGDQFTLDITGGTLSGATATTTGATTGVQAEEVSAVVVDAGTTYTLAESATGTTVLDQYTTSYQCVNTADSNAIVASGTLRSFTYTPSYAQVVECTFTNRAILPTIELQKDVVRRTLVGDQFVLTVTGDGLSSPGNTTTTTGSSTGIQSEAVGPLTVAIGSPYTFTETASATTDFAEYTTAWVCVDTAPNTPVILASGTGQTMTYAPAAGEQVLCTFENTPRVLVPSTLTVQKNVVGRSQATDQFTLTATGAALTGPSNTTTTTGTATGVQTDQVGPVSIVPLAGYTIAETAAGTTDFVFYDTVWTCIDTANPVPALASGQGRTGSFVAPEGLDIRCTFTNSPIDTELSLAKSVNEEMAVRGGVITYQVEVENLGRVPADGYTVSDPIPTGLTAFTWTCVASSGATCANVSGSGALNEVMTDLPAGGKLTYTIVANVAADAPREIANVAGVDIPDCFVNGVLVSPCISSPPIPVPAELTVFKNVVDRQFPSDQFVISSSDGGALGATATTTGTTTGMQPESAGPVHVLDSTTFTITEAGADTTDLVFYSTSWRCVDTTDGNAVVASGVGASGTVTVTLPTAPDAVVPRIECTFTNAVIPGEVTLQKVANDSVAVPEAPVTYTITATNSGTVPLIDTVISDPIPAGLTDFSWTCSAAAGAVCPSASGVGALNETIVTFPAGGVLTYAVSAMVTANPPAEIINTASIPNPPPVCLVDGVPAVPCEASPPLPVPPQISILKTTGDTAVVPDGTVNFTVSVTNEGVSSADGTTVSDVIPAGLVAFTWTCTATGGALCANASGTGAISETIATFPARSQVVYSIVADVSSNPPEIVTNTATATPPPTGLCVPGNMAPPCRSTVSLAPVPVVEILKTADRSYILPSGTIVYTVVASNTGVVSADGSVVSDVVPAGLTEFSSWTCAAAGGALCPTASGSGALNETIATFPAGSSLTFTITAAVTDTPIAEVTNVAVLTPPEGLCSPLMTVAPCSSEVTTPGVPLVSIVKTGDVDVVAPLGTVVYTITASNVGALPADGSVIADQLPAGITAFSWTCAATGGAECANASGAGAIDETIAVFPVGSELIFTVRAEVGAMPPGIIVNTATLSPPPSGMCMPDQVAGPCSSTYEVPTLPAVSILKETDREVVQFGDTITYTIRAINESQVPADGTVISDQVPEGIAAFDWSCSADGGAVCPAAAGSGTFSETVETFPVGSSLTYTVESLVGAHAPYIITNTARIQPPGACVPNGVASSEEDPCASTVNNPRPLVFTGVDSAQALAVVSGALGLLVLGAMFLVVPAVLRRRRSRAVK